MQLTLSIALTKTFLRFDCPSGQSCVIRGTGSFCTLPSKSCRNACSGNGICYYEDVNSGIKLSSCSIGDESCEAVCHCKNSYSGEACDISMDDLKYRQYLRFFLISTLNNLTSVDDISLETITSWSSLMHAISLYPFEVSVADIPIFQNVASLTIEKALDLGVSNYELLEGVLHAVDIGASIARYNYIATRVREIEVSDLNNLNSDVITFDNNTAKVVISVASKFAKLVSSSVVAGQNASEFKYSNFKLKFATISDASDSIPRNGSIAKISNVVSFERTNSLPSVAGRNQETAVLVIKSNSYNSFPPGNGNININLLETRARSYGDVMLLGYNSNPIRIIMEQTDGVAEIFITIPYNNPIEAYEAKTTMKYTVFCNGSDVNTYSYTCKDSGSEISHKCNVTTRGYLVSYCPQAVPSCARLNVFSLQKEDLSGDGICKVSDYTSRWVTCVCTVSPITRRLDDSNITVQSVSKLFDDAGVTDIVAISVFPRPQFAATFIAVPAPNNLQDGETSVTVIILFSAVWSVGICAVFYCFWSKKDRDKKKTKNRQCESNGNSSSVTESYNLNGEEIQKQLNSYINKVCAAKIQLKLLSI